MTKPTYFHNYCNSDVVSFRKVNVVDVAYHVNKLAKNAVDKNIYIFDKELTTHKRSLRAVGYQFSMFNFVNAHSLNSLFTLRLCWVLDLQNITLALTNVNLYKECIKQPHLSATLLNLKCIVCNKD